MKYYLISDNVDTLTGMRLVGIEGTVVHTEPELADALDVVLARKDVGILLLTEKLSGLCPQKILDIKLHRRTPLITIIPDRHGSGRAKDSITSYVQEAIGLKL